MELPIVRRFVRWVLKWCVRLSIVVIVIVAAFRWINPPTTYLMLTEKARIGDISHEWIAMDALPFHVIDAAVAAEDANFCRHYGFDMDAIRAAWADGASRGASTITQQTAKNVFLWPKRSWLRKGLEAGFSGLIEVIWGKRRIVEVYLNVAEFGTGIFGIEQGAQASFGVAARDLTQDQAARLMTVLPNPRERLATKPVAAQSSRIGTIRSGAASIGRDDRGACYRP